MIVVDTGALFAATERAEPDHEACAAVFRRPPGELVVPLSVIVESCLLYERRRGPRAEGRFLQAMADSNMTVVPLTASDLRRMADLIFTYDDLRLGAVDASIVTVAERLGASSILTLDRRHFNVVRPAHTPAFTLLP